MAILEPIDALAKLNQLIQQYNLTPHDSDKQRGHYLKQMNLEINQLSAVIEKWKNNVLTPHLDFYKVQASNKTLQSRYKTEIRPAIEHAEESKLKPR